VDKSTVGFVTFLMDGVTFSRRIQWSVFDWRDGGTYKTVVEKWQKPRMVPAVWGRRNPTVSSDGGLVRSVAATERSSLGFRICEGGGGEFIL
jgi:hypothetical protein